MRGGVGLPLGADNELQVPDARGAEVGVVDLDQLAGRVCQALLSSAVAVPKPSLLAGVQSVAAPAGVAAASPRRRNLNGT
jgi:hypothetical protein